MEEDLKNEKEEKTISSYTLTSGENELIEEIITGIHPSWNNLDKALFVYIELERRLDKSTSSETARLYNLILTRLEIPNRIIKGINGYSWNEIEIDEEYYPVDLQADLEYYQSAGSKGQIGVCNFAVNKEFYHNPNHATQEVSKSQKVIVPTLSPERINESLNAIAMQYNMARITERPTLRLLSKELSGLFEGGEVTRETLGETKELKITLTDSNIEDTRSDLVQIATFYPELLSKVELENTGTDKQTVQTMLDNICTARKIAKTSPVASKSFEIVISGANEDDFDLDYSGIEDVIIPGTTIDSETQNSGAKLTLRNVGTGSVRLADISNRLGRVEILSVEGMDIGNLDITASRVRRLETKGLNTTNISSVRGIENLTEISFNNVPLAELNGYLLGPYTRSNNLFNITIDNINLRNRAILREIRRGNPSVSNITIRYAHLNNLDGLEEFRDGIYDLNLYSNDLNLSDLERINRFYAQFYEPQRREFPIYLFRNTGIESEARRIGNVSKETLDYIGDIIDSADNKRGRFLRDRNGNIDIGAVVECLQSNPNIPYYLKDARTLRQDLKSYRNPIMIENESELDSTDFTQNYLNGATLLLTISQLEYLLNSGKTIPQKIRLKIENATELDLNKLNELRNRANALGINLVEVSIFDKSKANSATQLSAYTLRQYAEIREMLDILVGDIDPSEPDIDKFATIYVRLAEAIKYNLDSCSAYRKDKTHAKYYWEKINSCRNLFDGLTEWQCVCAGYADILRNALAMVGIEARIVSNDGHAWNQVQIDDGTGNKKWYDTDLTWDRQREMNPSRRGRYDWMLRGSTFFDPNHSNVKTKNVAPVGPDDYPRHLLQAAINRANRRNFDLAHSKDPISIPDDPIRVISLDKKRIQDEYLRRLDDMYAKFYGDREYEREYLERSKRFKSHEITRTSRGISYKTLDNYPERAEDEKFLLLDKYKETLERVSKYEAGDRTVYSGTPNQINQALERDREYLKTRNYTFNQHEHTQRDLATLGKYGERMPYIPRQHGILRNVGRVVLNAGILARNIVAPVYRGVGRFVAQPIHRLVTGGRDASPYRNNSYHRMVARRDYFLDEARKRDEQATEARRRTATDPNSVKPVRHPIRNILEARTKAIFKARKGNEAVLRAGAADIRKNIREQEGDRSWIIAASRQVADLRRQINALNQELITRPYAKNKAEVQAAIQRKTQLMNQIEQKLIKTKTIGTVQTDAVSNDEHAIASKEVNTLRVTAIKGVMKGVAIRYVGPKIHDWLMTHAKKTRTVPTTKWVKEETSTWVPTTYKKETTPIYEDMLDTGKSMSDIMSRNSGKQVTGFYSVWGGERRPATYSLTGNEKITAVFQQVGGGGNGLSDTVGLRAPRLTDGTFPPELLDGSGYLRQDISLNQLLEGLNLSGADIGALDGVYVSVGDRYWTSLANLVGGMTKKVQTGSITRDVIDVAGHMEKTAKWVRKVGSKTEEYIDPSVVSRINIGENIGKGVLGVDTIQDVFENVRNTNTNEPKNKKKPRKYTYTDSDLGTIPTSRREYNRRNSEDNER